MTKGKRQLYFGAGIFAALALMHFLVPFPYSMTLPVAWLVLYAGYNKLYQLVPALFFSFLGDVMGYRGEFLPQMGFFAIAQIAYIIIFYRNHATRMRRGIIGFLMLLMLTGACCFILPSVPTGILSYGVLIYIILLLGMCGRACLHGIIPLSVGACLFVISDSLIGINSFVHPLPYSHYSIMTTYYLAQILIVEGYAIKATRRTWLGKCQRFTM